MADMISRLKLESGEFDSKIARATKGLLTMEKECREVGGTLAILDKEQLEFVKGLGQMETVSQSTRGKIAELSGSFTELSMMYKRLTAEEKSAPFGRAMAASIDQLKVRIKGLNTDLAGVQAGMSGNIGSGFAQGIKGAFSMLGPAAVAAAGVTAAISGLKKVMGDMVQINMQFEQGTANLASIMGRTTDEIAALTEQAKNLGATTRYTAMQITELQTNLARLGFTQQEILNSTSAVQAFATATGADLGEAANLAGAALRGFGLNATEMERVASVMAVSTTKSALSFEKLATAVPIVAPVAKQFGFTIEDTITLLGKLSDAGMDASTAATATRNIFLKMANDSGKLATAMGRPVHSVEEFGEALKEMREKGMSLNDILNMVGVRSTAAFAVFADNAETLKDFKESITGCGDAMHDMESKQLNTLQGSITILHSAWEGLMLSFSESTGPIKTVVDGLTDLLQTLTKWRNRNAGGDAAIKEYEVGVTKKDEVHSKQLVQRYRNAGWSDEDISQKFTEQKAGLEKNRDAMHDLLLEWEKAGKLGWGSKAVEDLKPKVEELFGTMEGAAYKWSEQMQKAVAKVNDEIAVKDYIIASVAPAQSTSTNPNGSGSGVGSGNTVTATRRAQIEAEIKANIAKLDRMALGEEEYEAQVYAIKKAGLQQIADLYQDETKEKANALAAISQLEIQYQAFTIRLANQTAREKERLDKEEERRKEQELRQQKQLDTRILGGLTNTAKRVGLTAGDIGMTGVKTRIDSGVDITEEEWTVYQNNLNERLQSLVLDPIQINFETGNIETVVNEAKAEFERLMSDFSSGVGAVSDLVGAMDNLKNIGDDLAEVFSGEMDAWDSLMTVLNSGISVLETVISVTEAINTLKSLGIGLSEKKATTEGVEAAATVAAASTESAAEGEKAAASLGAAGANAAESSSAAGKAVSWIPIVGPILAVAAIAAVLGSTIAAISKSKSAGHYAQGGIVPGSDFTDSTPVFVSSGELILNKAQQNNVASALQDRNPLGNLKLVSRLSGKDILIAIDNTNRSEGGSRGYYTRIH